ncbi:hypothetical protein [Candidatus Poriferisocius sp.]|uniref:hypothetical protein n=1 Tax=Candidatus Poriferisocius sp. TaxID=3101276 RepID=UPI003B013436
MPTDRHRERGQQQPRGEKDGSSRPEANERGAAAPLELVILAPLLMLLVVFVLWAGRGGRAVLVADLAAGEAAVAAAVCCEDGPSDASERKREEVVSQVLSARPNLDFLCIGGVRPAALDSDGKFVDEEWLERFKPEIPGRASGVGVIGVRLKCETDGAVAPLRGLFPTVSFYGQAAEVVAIPPRLLISINDAPPVPEGDPGDTNELEFEIKFSAPSTQNVDINYEKTTDGTAEDDDHESASGSVTIPEGEHSGTISILITGDDAVELDETLEIELELLAPPDLCAPNAPNPPALANPKEPSADIEIQCDDPSDISTYGMPIDPITRELKPDYWKTQVTGTILNDDT